MLKSCGAGTPVGVDAPLVFRRIVSPGEHVRAGTRATPDGFVCSRVGEGSAPSRQPTSGSPDQLIPDNRWCWVWSCWSCSDHGVPAALGRGSPDRGGLLRDRASAAPEFRPPCQGLW